jgi:glycine/D-amino acid oxidase-like deaminating enzyme
VHITGGIMLAGTPRALDWLKMAKARGRYLGMDLEIISVDEAAKLFPLMDKKHFVGAMYDPIEGHVDPYGVTHAYAKSAQIGGAEIVRQTRVTDLKQRADGTWDVITDQGNVHAEHVVNAAACGRAKSAAWSGSSCRCSPWSISTSSPATCPNRRARRSSCTPSTSRARSTCARSAAAC